jgi:hypothetical protein
VVSVTDPHGRIFGFLDRMAMEDTNRKLSAPIRLQCMCYGRCEVLHPNRSVNSRNSYTVGMNIPLLNASLCDFQTQSNKMKV